MDSTKLVEEIITMYQQEVSVFRLAVTQRKPYTTNIEEQIVHKIIGI